MLPAIAWARRSTVAFVVAQEQTKRAPPPMDVRNCQPCARSRATASSGSCTNTALASTGRAHATSGAWRVQRRAGDCGGRKEQEENVDRDAGTGMCSHEFTKKLLLEHTTDPRSGPADVARRGEFARTGLHTRFPSDFRNWTAAGIQGSGASEKWRWALLACAFNRQRCDLVCI
jgi:hypothetical protein